MIDLVWARSLLAVYRQATTDALSDDATADARRQLVDALASVQARIAAHEDLESLWRADLGASEEGVRDAFAPLVAAAVACNPASAMHALVDFAAEEVADLFDETV